MIIASRTQFHVERPGFQPGEGPSRGLLCDNEPSDGTFWSTTEGCYGLLSAAYIQTLFPITTIIAPTPDTWSLAWPSPGDSQANTRERTYQQWIPMFHCSFALSCCFFLTSQFLLAIFPIFLSLCFFYHFPGMEKWLPCLISYLILIIINP